MNEIKALEADTKAQEEADKTGFQTKEAALKDELAKLSSKLATSKDEDRESEESLRKRKVKFELEVENWISRCGPPARTSAKAAKAAAAGTVMVVMVVVMVVAVVVLVVLVAVVVLAQRGLL